MVVILITINVATEQFKSATVLEGKYISLSELTVQIRKNTKIRSILFKKLGTNMHFWKIGKE